MIAMNRVIQWAISFALILSFSGSVSAAVFDIVIDTTPLVGQAAALAFDLIDGDGVANNTVTIQNFTLTDGTLGSATPTGGAGGGLPGNASLTDSSAFSEWLQELTLGTSLAFSLEVTTAFAGGFPDQFAFYLLDNDPLSAGYLLPLFATTDPFGFDRLLSVDLTDGPLPGTLQTYAAVSSEPEATWTASRTSVPTPSTLLLFGLGWWCLHVSRSGSERNHGRPS